MRILPPPRIATANEILLALTAGILLRFAVSLEPVWWLAWLAPALLLIQACKADHWRLLTLLTAVIAVTTNATYYLRVLPTPAVPLVIAAQALLWMFAISESRRAILRWRTPWTALVYPAIWVALDTLMAALLPDGNWASLAYSQAGTLPIMQTASLFGIAGVMFLLTLVPSVIATAFVLGPRTKGMPLLACGTAALLGAVVLFGVARLRTPAPTAPVIKFGLAAIDDAIGLQAREPYVQAIRQAYDEQIASLAKAGAHVVQLPEKIAVASEAAAAAWQTHLAAQAKTHGIWLSAGFAVQTPAGIVNDAWLFNPQGERDASYRKHFLAPPERSYLAGDAYVVRQVEGARYGIAICKDMHFASLGRAYGQRQAAVMLVPAWDFNLDRWMGERMTATRGIENGYLVVRNAREGLLTVSDAYGRTLGQQASGPLPGRSLVVAAPVPEPLRTLYTRIGNVLGWACVAIAPLLLWRARR